MKIKVNLSKEEYCRKVYENNIREFEKDIGRAKSNLLICRIIIVVCLVSAIIANRVNFQGKTIIEYIVLFLFLLSWLYVLINNNSYEEGKNEYSNFTKSLEKGTKSFEEFLIDRYANLKLALVAMNIQEGEYQLLEVNLEKGKIAYEDKDCVVRYCSLACTKNITLSSISIPELVVNYNIDTEEVEYTLYVPWEGIKDERTYGYNM